MCFTKHFKNDIILIRKEVKTLTINERIRYLRKEILGITQEELGKPLGLTRANIANIEAQRISVTDRVIIGLCEKYNISRTWIENGEGEIFASEGGKISRYMSDIIESDDEFIKKFIEIYWELDDTSKKVLKRIAKELSESQ